MVGDGYHQKRKGSQDYRVLPAVLQLEVSHHEKLQETPPHQMLCILQKEEAQVHLPERGFYNTLLDLHTPLLEAHHQDIQMMTNPKPPPQGITRQSLAWHAGYVKP